MDDHKTKERAVAAIDATREQLAREGWPQHTGDSVTPGPLTANFLLQAILHGKRFDMLGPDSKVLLEDPKYMRPWEVRGVRIEDGNLILDVWGYD